MEIILWVTTFRSILGSSVKGQTNVRNYDYAGLLPCAPFSAMRTSTYVMLKVKSAEDHSNIELGSAVPDFSGENMTRSISTCAGTLWFQNLRDRYGTNSVTSSRSSNASG